MRVFDAWRLAGRIDNGLTSTISRACQALRFNAEPNAGDDDISAEKRYGGDEAITLRRLLM